MEPSIEERTELRLQEFENKREFLQTEILKTFEEMKALLDSAMKGIEAEVTPIMDETEAFMDNSISDFQKMLARKKEILQQREKLAPLLDLFKQTTKV